MNDFPKLLVEFSDQAFEALRRTLQVENVRRREAFGTIEIFLAIQSCRAGVARQLLREVNSQTFWIENPQIGKTEYSNKVKGTLFTTSAQDVLQRALRIAKQNDEHHPGVDHLLLALVQTPDTAFLELLRDHEVDKAELQARLRKWLGFDEQVKPRTRAYELCAFIECDLKETTVDCLKAQFGSRWWVDGVPTPIRVECARTREEDGCTLDIDAYLYLTNLKAIIEANWKLFEAAMEKATGKKGKKSKKSGCAVSWMNEIRDTRNAVMHPSKRDICEEDIDSLRDANRIVRQFSANMQSVISKTGEA